MELPKELFVAVLEKDLSDAHAALSPEHEVDSVVMETPFRLATRRHARGLVMRSGENGHGKCLIGRVIFFESDQIDTGFISSGKLPENGCLDKILKMLNPNYSGLTRGERSRQRFEMLKWLSRI